MNNLYNETVTRQGRTYYYDTELDCFRPAAQQSRWDSYGWLAVILALATAALYLEFWPIR